MPFQWLVAAVRTLAWDARFVGRLCYVVIDDPAQLTPHQAQRAGPAQPGATYRDAPPAQGHQGHLEAAPAVGGQLHGPGSLRAELRIQVAQDLYDDRAAPRRRAASGTVHS